MKSHKKRSGKDSAHLSRLMEIMKDWDLLPQNYDHLLNFSFWNFKDQVQTGGKVHEYLLETYKRLRWIFKKMESKVTITERDVAVLGRKLFTFYEKKEHKIEYIRSLARESMGQDDITIHITRVECFRRNIQIVSPITSDLNPYSRDPFSSGGENAVTVVGQDKDRWYNVVKYGLRSEVKIPITVHVAWFN